MTSCAGELKVIYSSSYVTCIQNKMAANGRPKKKEVTFKIIVVGNADVGKSSLVKRYVTEQYDRYIENTIAVDCLNKEVTIQEQPIRVRQCEG